MTGSLLPDEKIAATAGEVSRLLLAELADLAPLPAGPSTLGAAISTHSAAERVVCAQLQWWPRALFASQAGIVVSGRRAARASPPA